MTTDLHERASALVAARTARRDVEMHGIGMGGRRLITRLGARLDSLGLDRLGVCVCADGDRIVVRVRSDPHCECGSRRGSPHGETDASMMRSQTTPPNWSSRSWS